MLFHSLYDDEGSGGYIEQFVCDLSGVNPGALKAGWSSVMSRHSILRSAFYYDRFSVPVQCVYRDVQLPVEELDYRSMDAAAQQAAAIKAYESADRAKGFDFKSAPLMRLGLLRLEEDSYRMVWTSHHILFDGWSLPVMMEEFLTTYDHLLSGQTIAESEEDRYEDYIRYLEQQDHDAAEHYWRHYLAGVSQGTLLPFIRTTTERTKGKGKYESLSLRLDEAATAGIQRYAQLHRLTVNTLMQGVWALLLHKYTGNREVLYGVVVSGRPAELPGVEQRVGMYINTLALKAVSVSTGNRSWFQGLQADQVSSRQYQYTALQDVQGWTGIKGDLFDSLLIFENYPVSKLITSNTWSLQVQNLEVAEQTNYPLTITIGISEELNIAFSYSADLLEPTYVIAIRDQFEQVLQQIAAGSADTLNEIRLLTSDQEHELLREFNNTEAAYPKEKSIVELFEEQVTKTPQAIATVFADQELTYKELNERSNQLAHYLQKQGVKAETLVPICIERSLEMLIGILGILKAGGAYVPVDPEYPADRISYMLEDTAAKLILSSKASSEKLDGSGSSNRD